MIAILVVVSTLFAQEAGRTDLPPHAVARLGPRTVLQGGTESLDVSPDGRRIATGGYDVALLRDASSGRVLKSFGPHGAPVQSVRFSPDGASLLTAASDGAVRLWELAGGTLVRTFTGATPPGFLNASFSGDGRAILCSTRRGELFAWEAATGKEVLRRSTKSWSNATAHSPKGSVAAFLSERKVHLLETAGGTETAVFPIADGLATSIAFSADGARLAIAGQAIQVWDVVAGTSLLRIQVGTWDSYSLAFSRDGKRIAAGDQMGDVRVWEIDGPKRVVSYRAHTASVSALAFSPDGTVLYSGSGRHVRMTSTADGTELLDGRPAAVRHTAAITALAVSPDGKMLVSADHRAVIRWSMPGGTALGPPIPFEHDLTDLAVWPDGKQFGVAIRDRARSMVLRDAATGESRGQLNNVGGLRSLAVSPDGTQVAAGDDYRGIRLWKGGFLAEKPLADLGDACLSLAFAPGGATLAGGDAILRLWDVKTGAAKPLERIHGRLIVSVGFSADGRLLMSCSDEDLGLWDPAAAKLLWKARVPDAQTAALSPDGRRIAVGCGDSSVRLIDASSGKELLKLQGHEGKVRRVLFLPDNEHLVSGGEDAQLLLWKPRP